jgi:hypothetical protein
MSEVTENQLASQAECPGFDSHRPLQIAPAGCARVGVAAEQPTETDRKSPGLGLSLLVAGAACLVGAGGLLWWRRGDAVFSDVVLAALAWCF